MDVEDWYHLDYFTRSDCDQAYSLLDGLDRYLQILADERVPSTFFAVGDLLAASAPLLRSACKVGHEVSSHGFDHQRPLMLDPQSFRDDLARSRAAMAEAIGFEPAGYRAPCFAIDRQRLEIIQEAGFLYDSSRIQFSHHPLYGTVDMQGFKQVRPWVYRKGSFFEFEISTLRFAGRRVPVSGGGYIRLLPWWLMRPLLSRYIAAERVYVLYIHPFELSPLPDPPLPRSTSFSRRVRFSRGRQDVPRRLRLLIQMLRAAGFQFATFQSLREKLLLPTGVPAVTL